MNNFWQDQIPSGYYDEILLKGLNTGRGIQSNWHNITFLEVSKYIKNEYIHLDYACGPGTFIGKYLDAKSIGVDISNQQINYANNKYGEKNKFLNLDEFQKIELSDNSLDVITIIGLFEFIKNEEIISILNDFYDKLKIGGKIIITTPNYGSTMKYLVPLVNFFGSVGYNHQHINKFDNTDLEMVCMSTKFQKMETKKIINIGIFASFISIDIGKKFNDFLNRYFLKNNGYLLVGILKK